MIRFPPPYQSVVIVLMGCIQCPQARTLSGWGHRVAQGDSLSGLSRFFAQALWEIEALAARWHERFRTQMTPVVQAKRRRQQEEPPTRRGRPKAPVVTGELIGDDSTMHKEKGRTMDDMGTHQSPTHQRRVRRHRLVQGRSVFLQRRCPPPPRLSRQQHVCEPEPVPFQSPIDLVIERIQSVEPVAGTLPPVLLNRWSGGKAIGKAARGRGFLVTTGLTCNRSPAIARTLASPTDGGGNSRMRPPPRSRLRMTPNAAGHMAKKRNRWTCRCSRNACGSSPSARGSSCRSHLADALPGVQRSQCLGARVRAHLGAPGQ